MNRVIPEDKVWKFIFEISHAPHYVRQFPNGTFAGIYAPVENVQRDNAVPFGLSEEKVTTRAEEDHVEVNEIPIEQSPWAEGTYLNE